MQTEYSAHLRVTRWLMSNQTNARFSALQRLLSLLFVFTLFLGLLPAFFMQLDRTVNAVLITVLSLLCFFLLRVSLPDSVKNRG